MSKHKIITIIIVVLVLSVGVGLFIYGTSSKKEVINIDTTLPPIENNDKIQGNKEDLISFSILPDTKVKGILSYRGSIKGGYFFEGNILINILDLDKRVLKASNAVAKSDWMTALPVSFEGNIDFTNLPKGSAYFEIKQDDPSGGESGRPIKSILIPIVVE
jgi:hypothetical protein